MILVMLIIMKIMCNSPNHITLAWIPNHHRSKDPLSLGRMSKREPWWSGVSWLRWVPTFQLPAFDLSDFLGGCKHETTELGTCFFFQKLWKLQILGWFQVSLWISFFLAGTFFGGGGGVSKNFWSGRAFFRSCYLRYEANPPITVSLGCPGVCNYRGVFPVLRASEIGFSLWILCCVWGTW